MCRDGHVCPSWIVTHFILWTWLTRLELAWRKRMDPLVDWIGTFSITCRMSQSIGCLSRIWIPSMA
jgi:hypothetical protein